MPRLERDKPILALTLSLAGKRHVAEPARAGLTEALNLIFEELAGGLAKLHGQTAAQQSLAMRFSADRPARLTLVTGLADGSDQIASALFLSPRVQSPVVERLLGAILPCGRDAYVSNSPVEDKATFARQAAECAFIVELDGELPGGSGDDRSDGADTSRLRGSAFGAQSEFLVRQCDLLVAVDDAVTAGQIGGTRQSVRDALEFGLPVILICLGEPGIAILRTRSDLQEPVRHWGEAARAEVGALVSDLIGSAGTEFDEAYVGALLKEFYAEGEPRGGPLRMGPALSKIWTMFESRFKRRTETTPSQLPPEPYRAYRARASALSGYYAGLYRGSFIAGYGLALIAVALAVLSLVTVLAIVRDQVSETAGTWVLLGLGLLKLLAVSGMAVLGRHAHGEHLSHRAADYRYLSERLRAMVFLPHAGSLRPPSHLSQPYATRVATQGVIDRLFFSIVRQASPLETLASVDGKTIRPDAQAAMRIVRDGWLAMQRRYHENNAIVLSSITQWLERWGRRLNTAILVVVLLDLVLVGLGLAHVLPHRISVVLHEVAEPFLIAIAAILPAAVTSMNGVRFQSEFSRLADRSEQMKFELLHLEQRADTLWARSDRLLDVLHVAEDAARLTLDEVAEWTAIYGKEFVEM